MERWLSIVGIGEDGWDGLHGEARRAIESAELIYGGTRHLAMLPNDVSPGIRIHWPSPMAEAVEKILKEHRGKARVTVLASGDPMLYGVGVSLTRELAPMEFRVIPQVSAFSLACARLGWPMAETTLISLVNRPIAQLHRLLSPGQRLVVFSEDGNTPALVARFLADAGYGASCITLFENLGGPLEKNTAGIASEWAEGRCGNLNLMAVACIAGAAARSLSLVAGLPDDVFESDGQFTKREVRAVTLAKLAPLPGQILWDVGAGTGTIGIEWMRVHASCSCVAFEAREDRAERIRSNAQRLGVPSLKVIEGMAPVTFVGLPRPDAIFLGGDVANDALFAACWENLARGGRLVANAVTIEGEVRLIARHGRFGGELLRMTLSRAEGLGSSYAWRPALPITQWAVTKP